MERVLLNSNFWDVDYIKRFLVGPNEFKEAATLLGDLTTDFKELFDEQSYMIRCLVVSVELEFLTRTQAGEPVDLQELLTEQFFTPCNAIFDIITKAKDETVSKCQEGHSFRAHCVVEMFKQAMMMMQDNTNNNVIYPNKEAPKLKMNKALVLYMLDKMNWLLSMIISKEMASEYLFERLIPGMKDMQNSLVMLTRIRVPSIE
mmetsp:Transcript_6171/g.9959  ORF Transcript_6171/g.9959 Transcript_6171/m.9959 type:complete len:203 (+) Transcript_6171:2791-3399(+)|eukprot:CAMPEP_0170483866 /NCGR_PEP_ID=MMETSP0208-20121228/3464_1 /TAXON_ID=197538 /ORGANISM="Strombidium inclinatum, Strain S3" /LENGTH=202 /DNA_ID=CAMNT_0010757051 /DNA_START=2753 /DNA_END=3361 /DNA_ORIENTATION=-